MHLTWLVGKRLTEVTKRLGDWSICFDDGSVLITECFWRLINSERILVTSLDQGQKSLVCVHRDGNDEIATVFRDVAHEVLGYLTDAKIRSAIVKPITNDIQIDFDSSLSLSVSFDRSNCGAWCIQSTTLNVIATAGNLALHPKQCQHYEKCDPSVLPVVREFES